MSDKHIKNLSKAELLDQYGAIATKMMSRSNIPRNYYEDIKQDALIAIITAQKTYDYKKARFSTYVFQKIRKAISDSIYRNCYGLGMSGSFYYRELQKTDITKVALESIAELNTTKDEYFDLKNRAIASFCQKINQLYDAQTCDLIIDYYIDGLKYGELLKKYGNITKRIRDIDLENVFKSIKRELNEQI